MSRAAIVDPRKGVWSTDDELYLPLHRALNFKLDAAALKENAKCKRFFSPKEDGLRQEWDVTTWCNPPYGRGITENWVLHGKVQAWAHNVKVCMLLPIKADTYWWHRDVWGSNRVQTSAVIPSGPIRGRWYRLEEPQGYVELVELLGRQSFGDSDNNGFFASAVVLFNAGRYPVLPFVR